MTDRLPPMTLTRAQALVLVRIALADELHRRDPRPVFVRRMRAAIRRWTE